MYRHLIVLLFQFIFIACLPAANKSETLQEPKAIHEETESNSVLKQIRKDYESVYSNEVKISQIGASGKLENSIGSGSFDSEFSTRKDDKNYYAPNLSDCSLHINKLVIDWRTKKKLALIRSKVSPGEALFHLYSQTLQGYFEIRYRLLADQKKAKISFLFFGKNATQKSALFSELDGIDEFAQLLDEGLTCTEK